MSAIVATQALRQLAADGGEETISLYAKWGQGVEQTASAMELRLALLDYRRRHGPDHWRLHAPHMARC
ncbi:hypothetical protein D9601_10295 [Sphingomonas sp. MA1305]|uniref:hypothetical protein n=1 Tax=Sphingomonas sp. MA1305 TaxID=2479204 RepID=UPI0018DFE39F|nr:hypothetical protein [Sphingomonas sp. MA1305]MBI0475741.1 hypothetical protein [Sphingomonas sp. MA1305]